LKLEIKNNQELGKILKQRREKLAITQKQLADICDLSHNGISRIEIGHSDIKLSTLLKISKIIGINLIIETGD
jgi:transcriptional regulator with XRE-family HTH domain